MSSERDPEHAATRFPLQLQTPGMWARVRIGWRNVWPDLTPLRWLARGPALSLSSQRRSPSRLLPLDHASLKHLTTPAYRLTACHCSAG